MKANELRIGNLVLNNGEFVQFNYFSYPMGHEQNRVAYLYPNTPGHNDNHNCIDNLEPIPLTPEILEKCGFDVTPPYNTYTKNDLDACFGFRNGVIEGNPKHIKYLHQLQNFFFALTGEELKINLNEKQYHQHDKSI